MPTYVTLANFTEDGIEHVDEIPQMFEDVKELKRSLGGEPRGVYLTLGQYDVVAVSEMPDDVSTARLQLASAMDGHVETETLRAFDEAEIAEVLEGLPE